MKFLRKRSVSLEVAALHIWRENSILWLTDLVCFAFCFLSAFRAAIDTVHGTQWGAQWALSMCLSGGNGNTLVPNHGIRVGPTLYHLSPLKPHPPQTSWWPSSPLYHAQWQKRPRRRWSFNPPPPPPSWGSRTMSYVFIEHLKHTWSATLNPLCFAS